jgi:pilus assembly protein CpaC
MGQDEPAQPPPAAQPAQKAPPPPAPRRVRELTEAPAAPSTAGANRAGATTAEPQRVIPMYPGESRLIDAPWPVARVSVANPDVADVDVINPQQLQIIGIAPGVTNFIMWSKDERTWRARVEVEPDLSKLQGQLDKLFPRAKLQASQLGDMLVLKGTLAKSEESLQLRQFLEKSKLNHLDLSRVAGSQQVQLKVRIAEVSRTALRSLSSDFAMSDGLRGIAVNNAASGTYNPGTFPPTAGDSIFTRTLPGGTTIFGTGTAGEYLFEYFIQALAENQYLRLLSEPTLVAYSGEEATFLVGGEVPIPVSEFGDGSTSISIEYREYGVRLRFRPTVTGEGGIRLVIEPEVSELTDVGSIVVQGTQIPALLTRRISTTLELQTGQTFAMAGLLNQSINARNSRIPWLGDLPILGTLFRSVRYSTDETELVVLVTASLAEPQSIPIEDAPYPGMTHTPPNDWELYIRGSLEGKTPRKIAPVRAQRMEELGLDKLNGPGAWAGYDPATTQAMLAAAKRGKGSTKASGR